MDGLVVGGSTNSFLSPSPSAASVTPTSSLLSQSQLRRNRIKGSVRPPQELPALSTPTKWRRILLLLWHRHPVSIASFSLSLFALSLELSSRNSIAPHNVFILPSGMDVDDRAIGRGGSMITARELLLVVADRLRLVSRKPVSSSISSYLI